MRAPPDPKPSIGALIGESYRQLNRNFNARVRDHGLTQTQWQALAALARREGIKQAELAEMLQVAPISLARLMDRMEAAGWIERRPDPRDRRALQLYLTAKVDPILDEMYEASAQTREQAMADMNETERAQLLSLLTRLATNLRGTECKPADLGAVTKTVGTTTKTESGTEIDEPQTGQQSQRRRR